MIRTSPTYGVRLYLSGPIEFAKQAARMFCKYNRVCVTIEPTLFIYTGGEESGYVVGLVNYPRFPKTPEEIRDLAHVLMLEMLAATHQHSALMVTPEESVWISTREDA